MRKLPLAVIAVAVVAAIAAYVTCRAPAVDPATPPPVPSHARARIAELRHQLPGAIAGTVTANGAGVVATVCARSRDGERCTTSDTRGAYAIGELAPGSYVAFASAPGIGGGRHDGDIAVATDHRVAGVDIALVTGTAQVRGHVRDVRGRAIAGAEVHVATEANAPPAYTARSDADGAFAAWVRPGDVRIEVEAEHFVDGDARAIAPTDAVVVELVPESVLAGVVIEAGTRRPLDDAQVDIAGHGARTDAAGKFRIGKLSPGRYKPTATSIGGYGETAESVRVALGATVDGLVIEVHPVAVVAGRIVADDGTPCPPDRGEVWLERYGSRAAYVARTTDAGEVLLEGVVPGTYGVRAGCSGWLSQLPYPDLVVGNSDVEDLAWHVSTSARIIGRVVARGGAPVADAVVNHRLASGASFGSTTSGADGRFTATGVAPGVTEVAAYADGHLRSENHTVVASLENTAAVELQLDVGGSIAGVVVDESGAPLATGVDVNGPSSGSTTSDAQGRFTVDSLEPGDYKVRAQTGWDTPAGHAVPATVTAGGTAHVRVVGELPTGEITGTVVDDTGAPITDAYVSSALETVDTSEQPVYRSRGSWHTPAVLTGLDGSFRLTNLPRGKTFSVRAARDDAGFTVVEAVALGDHPRLVIKPTGVLAGVVTGAHVEDVTVSADERARGVSREERLYHTNGRFALRDLPAGSYRIAVDGDPRSAITVTLGEGERREDVRLVAQPRYTVRGRLVANGRPVRGWTVDAPRLERDDTNANGRRLMVSEIETAITGADGRFLLRNLPAGPLEISAGDLTRDPEAKLAVVRNLVLQGATDIDAGDIEVR